MTDQVPKAWLQRRNSIARFAEQGNTAARKQVTDFANDVDGALARGKLDGSQWSQLKFTCSSLLINLGSSRRDVDAVEIGIHYAQEVLDRNLLPAMTGQLRYNVANGLSARHEIGLAAWRLAQPTKPRGLFAMQDRENVRRTRTIFAEVGYSADESGDQRGRALCNLGNILNQSGRWLEAYQAYVDALSADPTNGNAAGNAAELLRVRVARGRGLSGHYAALYDQYREKALEQRERTIELAGEEVAKRWDDLPPSGSKGHLSHEGDPLDPYQQWIRKHRLPLSVAVEGLGSDEPRWDSATIRTITVPVGEPDPPTIFMSMNVLKAEFLVARRLAYEGERLLDQSPYAQHPTDTGTYVDTLDMSLYGEPPAMLILAQRATLDLLDKMAVAANDHFQSGIAPRRVTFAGYWREHGSDEPRKDLPVPDRLTSAAVALAELAFDMDPTGLYPEAKTLRNAGTHRLVHVTHGQATGVTEQAHSSVDIAALITATHESLRVARAAYIYLIDLIQDQQDFQNDGKKLPQLPLRDQI